ncbi:hypothetical protein [Erwinia piriflorinigrans]|uniref:Uncharacterized protein n=1 Tax=Erwinia piriflorinigrans CFBP 5888 TaxID=1161919 RepID=V5ZC92_9GAMM|nr:hypothetical protein [Erwinia piriflorinigrans]CCG88541.1 hypothetical protein EPIR_3178 [Erwinia piriflorinigrans CFBP 5888]
MSNSLFSAARPGATAVLVLTYGRALARKSQYFLAGILLWGGLANGAWALLNFNFGKMDVTYLQKTGAMENRAIPASFFGAAWTVMPGEPAPQNGLIEEFILGQDLVLPAGITLGMNLTFETKFSKTRADGVILDGVTCIQRLIQYQAVGKVWWKVSPARDCPMPVMPVSRYVGNVTSSGMMRLVNTTDKPFRFTTLLTVKMYQGAQVHGVLDFIVEEGRSCTIDIANSLYLGRIAASTLQKTKAGEIIDDLGGMLGTTLKCNSGRGGTLTITSASISADGCANDNIGSLNYCVFIDGKKFDMGKKYYVWEARREKNITFLTTKGKNITGGRSEAKILLTFEPH